MTTAREFLSIYIETFNSSSSFIKSLLHAALFKKVSNAEITIACSVATNQLIPAVEEWKELSFFNRICVNSLSFYDHQNHAKHLSVIKNIAKICDNVAVEVNYDVGCISQHTKTYFCKLLDSGVKHVTIQQFEDDCFLPDLNSHYCSSDKKNKCKGYSQYFFIRDILLDLGFVQYELCNFAIHDNFKSVNNVSLWEGRQFLGVGSNAHSRVSISNENPFDRCALTCYYKNSKFHFSKTKLSRVDVLEELLYLGLRTIDGIRDSVWRQASGGISLHEIFQSNVLSVKLFDDRYLIMTQSALMINPDKLIVLDTVLIVLLQVLHEHFNLLR